MSHAPMDEGRRRLLVKALFGGATSKGAKALPMNFQSPSAPLVGEVPQKRDLVLVTAALMGDPKPDYVRAELRQDEGGSAPVGPDDQVWMEVAWPRWRSPPAIAATQLTDPAKGERAPPVPAPNESGKCAWC
jgi:hypothetical protein